MQVVKLSSPRPQPFQETAVYIFTEQLHVNRRIGTGLHTTLVFPSASLSAIVVM